MPPCHSFSTEVVFICRNFQKNIVMMLLDTYMTGVNQGGVVRYMGVCRVTTNRLCVRYNNAGRLVTKSGRPRAQDRYIRLMHLKDLFRTTSTASQIHELRRNSSQTVIRRLRQACLQARRPVRRNVLTTHHLAERLVVSRTYSMETSTVENSSVFR